MKTEMKTAEEIIKEAAWKGFKAAANAYRMYPDAKHAFGDHWFPEALYAEQIEDVKSYAKKALDIAAEEAKVKAEYTGPKYDITLEWVVDRDSILGIKERLK